MRPFPRRPRPPLRMLHWSRFRIRAAENSPHNPSDNAGHYRGDPVFTEHQQDLRLTSTSRPLFLKLLMRWFSKPAFSAMAVCVCVSSPCVLSRSSVQTLNPRSSEPRANRRDSIIFFPHLYSEKSLLLRVDWLQQAGIRLDCLLLCADVWTSSQL